MADVLVCPRCGRQNAPGDRFCGACGAALPLLCGTCGVLNEVDEALGHDVTVLRQMVETLVNPATGNSLSFLGNPLKWAASRTLSYPPRLGEHTRAVLTEVCGYDVDRIEELARAGAIATGGQA